jgi:hypothetical protein
VLQGVGSDSDTFRVGADGLRRRRRSESSLRLLRKDGGVRGNRASSRDGAACRPGRVGVLTVIVDDVVLHVRDSNCQNQTRRRRSSWIPGQEKGRGQMRTHKRRHGDREREGARSEATTSITAMTGLGSIFSVAPRGRRSKAPPLATLR